MAEINHTIYDTTLLEIDKELEKKQKLEKPRHYLGMSQIGDPCHRKLFYSFRNSEGKEIPSSNIKAIEDGYTQEEIMAKRLRMLPFIELHTVDPNNPEEQIGHSLLLGHFNGHMDGVIKGILEAPKTWHVWEHKSVQQKKINKLVKLREEHGEKNALELWDEVYYNQAQIYMHESQLERHYLTVTTPGGRDYISIRTNYARKEAEKIIEKAKSIIFDNWIIPSRLSDNRDFYLCKWCEFQEVCHDKKIPLVNCKTCRYSEPVKDGMRECLFSEKIIPQDFMNSGCKDHVFNPALIQANLIEHQKDGCLYKIEEKNITFFNGPKTSIPEIKGELDAIYTSDELRKKIISIENITRESVKIQQDFNGEIIDDETKAWDNVKIDGRLQDI